MNRKNLINVYCDETCHLQYRDSKSMVLGAVYCHADTARSVSDHIRSIKKKHSIPRHFETKWTKISHRKLDYYLDLVDYFFNESPLKFRAVLIPDKTLLDHRDHNQTHDDWYYKMYYFMLRWIVQTTSQYHFYIDIKDTKGATRVKRLHECLANTFHDFNHECIEKVQQIRSDESELMQIADLLIGAIGHANNFPESHTAKYAIINRIQSHISQETLSQSSSFTEKKFNIFCWDAHLS